MNEVTRLLNAAEAGDGLAAEKLIPLAYEELSPNRRKQAGQGTRRPHAPTHRSGPRGMDSSGGVPRQKKLHCGTAGAIFSPLPPRAMRRIPHRKCPPQVERQAGKQSPR